MIPKSDLMTLALLLCCVEHTLKDDLKAQYVIPNDFNLLIESVKQSNWSQVDVVFLNHVEYEYFVSY